jgi:hypothetical protein
MESLNLSGESRKSDGAIKSLMWPTVDNAWDVDYLGQQGFWICFIIAILTFGLTALAASELPLASARALLLVFGAIESLVYFVGGMGVRQSSSFASIAVFVLYALEHLVTGQIGVLTIIIAAVLLSNVRATILASRWAPAGEDEDRPTRFDETLRDKLVDQLPPRLWPILKYPFYALAAITLLVILASPTMRLIGRSRQSLPDEGNAPSAVVTPSAAK